MRQPSSPEPAKRVLPRLVFLFAVFALLGAGCAASSDGDTTVAASETESSSASAPAESAAPDTDASVDDDAGGDATEPAGSDDTDSSDTDGADDDSSGSSDSGDSSDSSDENASDDEPAMAASSPIGAFFADDGGFEAALEEYTARVNDAITRCMANQGFEFAAGSGGNNAVQQAQNEMTVREWTREFGYGISTSFDTIAENRRTDPNAAIVLSMSAGEREAWLDTLLGPDREGFNVDIGARPLEEQGCIGEGIIETGGQGAIQGLEEFGDAYDEGEQAIFDRTEMITAVDAWSQCMAGAGYTGYAAVDDPEDDIGERLGVITAPLNAALDEIDEEEARALIDGTNDGLERLPGLDVDALRALQAEEREVAIVDLDCYEEHVRETYEPLRDAFERGLMDTYADQLNALKNIGQ